MTERLGRCMSTSVARLAHGTGRGRPLVDRFWARVDVRGNDECWLWLGPPSGRYGRITAFDTTGHATLLLAHRLAYELLIGPIPAGLVLDHYRLNLGPRCAPCSRFCVNPAHLEPVTNDANVARGDNHYRHHDMCPRGHPYDVTGTRKADGGVWRGCRRCRKAARQRFNARKKGGVS